MVSRHPQPGVGRFGDAPLSTPTRLQHNDAMENISENWHGGHGDHIKAPGIDAPCSRGLGGVRLRFEGLHRGRMLGGTSRGNPKTTARRPRNI
jgi:hypothetical protein